VLARAAFGQSTSVGDLWRAQRSVWWRHFIISWTWRRLSPWRSFTQPVYQLEGLPFFQIRGRIVQLRRRYGGAAFVMTQAFFWAESCLTLALVSLVYWFAPADQNFDLTELYTEAGGQVAQLAMAFAYYLTVVFLEPFYVAAGFGMYLNRRAELEAWDIEQEFRRAFAD